MYLHLSLNMSVSFSVFVSLILLLSVHQSKSAHLFYLWLYLCLFLYPRILVPNQRQGDSLGGGLGTRLLREGGLPTPLSTGARGACAFKRGRARGPRFPARRPREHQDPACLPGPRPAPAPAPAGEGSLRAAPPPCAPVCAAVPLTACPCLSVC